MTKIAYDKLDNAFYERGAVSGLDELIADLQGDSDHHALFRSLLLRKRFELGLPLVNAGDLSGVPDETRKAYETFVEHTCREIGARCLDVKWGTPSIAQAWRYFRTLGEKKPIQDALDKIEPANATDDDMNIAIEQGVHPRRGFQIILERDGLCRAISLYDDEYSTNLADKKFAASMLVKQLYKDLVNAVSRLILERFGELPPETDLVDLIRHRPWLFENSQTHADPQHIAAISRIGLITESNEDLIMTLSIAEFGRMLDPRHKPSGRAPFEAGFNDYALYARALLGQNVATTVEHFRARLSIYDATNSNYPAEMVVMLLWRTGQKSEALHVWQHYLSQEPPEIAGIVIPSFYDLCIEAGEFGKLADTARSQGDMAAWAAARVMTVQANKTQPAPS